MMNNEVSYKIEFKGRGDEWKTAEKLHDRTLEEVKKGIGVLRENNPSLEFRIVKVIKQEEVVEG